MEQREEIPVYEPVPWLTRAQTGVVPAFIQTVRGVFFRPANFFAALAQAKAPIRDSLRFYLFGSLAVVAARIAVDLPVLVVSAQETGALAVLKGFFTVLLPMVVLTIIGVWAALLVAVWGVGLIFGFREFSKAAAVVSYSVPVIELAFLFLTVVLSIVVRLLHLARVPEGVLTGVLVGVSVCVWVVFIHWIAICAHGLRQLFGTTTLKGVAVVVLAILLLGAGRFTYDRITGGGAAKSADSAPLPGASGM